MIAQAFVIVDLVAADSGVPSPDAERHKDLRLTSSTPCPQIVSGWSVIRKQHAPDRYPEVGLSSAMQRFLLAPLSGAMCQPGGTRTANRFERRRCLSKGEYLVRGSFQRTPLRMKKGRKSSRSFKDGSDFLRTIAPYQQVTSSEASFLGSCAVSVPPSF